jgi:hypothetical protein
MADLSFTQQSQVVQIVGADVTGLEQRPMEVDANGNALVRDSLNIGGVEGAISVSTTALEAKVSGTRYANRKILSVTPTTGIIYWGFSASVTTATGTPIFKNSTTWFNVKDIPIYLIASSSINVRITEGA